MLHRCDLSLIHRAITLKLPEVHAIMRALQGKVTTVLKTSSAEKGKSCASKGDYVILGIDVVLDRLSES